MRTRIKDTDRHTHTHTIDVPSLIKNRNEFSDNNGLNNHDRND